MCMAGKLKKLENLAYNSFNFGKAIWMLYNITESKTRFLSRPILPFWSSQLSRFHILSPLNEV